MKKIYSIFVLVAMLCTSMCMFTSCGKDDTPEPEPTPTPETVKFKYTAGFSEDVFKYCDVNVIIEDGEKKTVFPFEEKMKVADIGYHENFVVSGRVLQIPDFEFSSLPLRITTDIKLNDAARELIAKGTDEEFNFVVCLEYGLIDGKGLFTFPSKYENFRAWEGGVHVNELQNFLNMLLQMKYFDNTFRR